MCFYNAKAFKCFTIQIKYALLFKNQLSFFFFYLLLLSFLGYCTEQSDFYSNCQNLSPESELVTLYRGTRKVNE